MGSTFEILALVWVGVLALFSLLGETSLASVAMVFLWLWFETAY